MIWGIQALSEAKATPDSFLDIFELKPNKFFSEFAETILEEKTFKTYYFSREHNAVDVKDISTLDPEDMDEAVSDWGGLTAFSTRLSEIVAKVMWEGER